MGLSALIAKIPLWAYPMTFLLLWSLGSRVEVHNLKNEAIVKQAKADNAVAEANARANVSSQKYETAIAAQKTRTIFVTRKVHDAIASEPAWASMPIPASVRSAIAEAASAVDSGQPHQSVRASGSSADDQRRTSGGLHASTGVLGRLFHQAPAASASPP